MTVAWLARWRRFIGTRWDVWVQTEGEVGQPPLARRGRTGSQKESRSSQRSLQTAVWAFLVVAFANSAHAADVDTWHRCMSINAPVAAIKACSDIIAGHEGPENLPYAYVYRGAAQLYCHRLDQAQSDLEAALKLPVQLAHAHFRLAEVYKAREDWSHAAEEFAKAASSTAEDADIDRFASDSLGNFRWNALSERGYALYKVNDFKQPLTDFTEATKDCATCSMPYRYKALVLIALQKFDDAAKAANRAITLDWRYPGNFFARGLMHARSGHYDLAVTDYTEALRLKPDFELAYYARSFAYSKLGKTREAAADDQKMAAVKAEVADKRRAICSGSTTSNAESENESDAPDGSQPNGGLDEAAVMALVAGKGWQADQGIWAADLQFRRDGTFRQVSKDRSDKTLQVTMDGAWAVSRGKLCIYTSSYLCMTARLAGDRLTLTRDDDVLEYAGAVTAFKPISIDNTSAPIAEFPLLEKFLPGTQPRTGKGRTLLYYIHGFDGRARVHSPMLQFFAARLQKSEGWDVVDADYPLAITSQLMRFQASNYAAATFVARRLKELKAQGYDHIFVGGQSWGGWTTLALASHPDLPIDGTVLVVPACCGWSINGSVKNDPEYPNNKIYFEQMIARVRYPIATVFFGDDEFEPADRGQAAMDILAAHEVPNLVIDHPAGLAGHGAGWFPLFDYSYGNCILGFLQDPQTVQCPFRPLANNDFRAVLSTRQMPPDWSSRKLTAADLTNRVFAVYPDGDLRKLMADGNTAMTSYGGGETLAPSSFRDGAYCSRQVLRHYQPDNTDETCRILVKWSDHDVLAVDPANGRVTQWWVEQNP